MLVPTALRRTAAADDAAGIQRLTRQQYQVYGCTSDIEELNTGLFGCMMN
jgi:hypothetical protein